MADPIKPALSGKRPFFSVITAVSNGAATLEATIASLCRQSFQDFEYIIFDAASTDGTVAILKQYDPQIAFWRSELDSGIYNAWNKAIKVARGEWISFLGADDIYHDDALADYARAISADGSRRTQYVSSRVRLLKNGKIVRTIGSAWSWPAFSRFMTVAHVGSMHHHTLFKDQGLFDESYRSGGDYELLLRPRDQLRAIFLDRVTADMALGGASNANVYAALAEQERAKRSSGGRSSWLCAYERRRALLLHGVRRLLWY
jgi:glycosyltransferase involved in cell wall biosynthesis